LNSVKETYEKCLDKKTKDEEQRLKAISKGGISTDKPEHTKPESVEVKQVLISLLLKFPKLICTIILYVIALAVLVPLNTCYSCCRKSKNLLVEQLYQRIYEVIGVYLNYPLSWIKKKINPFSN
jgi:hypothetical protein